MAAPTSTHRVHLGMRVTQLSVLLLVIALIAGFASPASAASRAAGKACRDKSENTRRLDLKVKGEKTFGYFALPNRKPRGLVVFFHGNTQSAITSRSTLPWHFGSPESPRALRVFGGIDESTETRARGPGGMFGADGLSAGRVCSSRKPGVHLKARLGGGDATITPG